MPLRDIFPLQYVRDKFDKEIIVEEYDFASIDKLSQINPQQVIQICHCIWHQIVTRNLFRVDPTAMGGYLEDPFMYKKIEACFGIQAIHDLYSVTLRIKDEFLKKNNECCQLCLAHTFPNDIVLSDISFMNPYKPISKKHRQYRYTYYEGLKLLPTFMKRLREYSLEINVDRIILTAAALDLVPLFNKYGFEVDGSPLAKRALEVGFGIPMHLLLK